MRMRWWAALFVVMMVFSAFAVSFGAAKGEKVDKIDKKVLSEVAKEGKVDVIVKLKDTTKQSIRESIKGRVFEDIGKDRVRQEFPSLNGFSASLGAEDIAKLEQDGNVERVYYDRPVSIDLQDSTVLINATRTWALKDNGINLTGRGETICVIDTGIDYTHPDLGNCTPVKLTLNGTNESYALESAHNYTSNYDYTWNITKPGYAKIGLHFRNLSTESVYDYVYILDGNQKIVADYSGTHNDIWSPSVEGDTIYVRLVSDESVVDYGFYIDQTINGTTNTTYDWSNCSKVIGGWDSYNYDPDPKDDHGHGTHAAGIAAANGAIKGVAPDAKIVAIKALGAGGTGQSGDVIAGIEWCTSHSDDLNISVISMSLGGGQNSSYCDSSDPVTAAAINAAVAKNISVVIAAGNDGSSSKLSYPACIQNATPIGSVDKSDSIASDSNRNANLKLFAPGVNINSTCNGGGYCLKSGTSMATPHAAGAFAIANQFLRKNGLRKSPQTIESAFNATGKRIPDGSSGLNFSRINLYDAIFYLDSFAPTVSLANPAQNIANNTAIGGLNLTFKCNASDNLALRNGTFYLWNETSIRNQSFFNLSGATGSIEVNITNISEGSYKWNCLFYDASGNSAFASANRTINYRLVPPNVTLNSPADGASGTAGSSISFEYNVTHDITIENCSLIVGGNASAYNSSEITNETNLIAQSFSVGSYNWSISCIDKAGNTGNSSSRTITINAAPPSGGGGGGGKRNINTSIASSGNATVNETITISNQSASAGQNNEPSQQMNAGSTGLTYDKSGMTLHTMSEQNNASSSGSVDTSRLRTAIIVSMAGVLVFLVWYFYSQYRRSLMHLSFGRHKFWG